MTANVHTLSYLQRGVTALLELGRFRNGEAFKPTQGDALAAYRDYLFSNELGPEKLKGFFELPTGIGKTALFLSIIDEAHRAAAAAGDELRTMIVVPTTQLLAQTKKALKKWAPDYEHKVGLYGGRSRTLDKELTIITYESWKTLMEERKIDSSKIDILISDEAHRGTSERSLTNQFNSFASGTAQIAFTATARFDDEKSVEQSHGHQIFSRGVAESIRLGELAAYIQTQLYVIRTQPPEKREEFNENADPMSAIRAGMRQEAWMRQMVQVYREGRDEHTGDLLSDNKAGFYVGDIAMADTMAERLNEDPVLQERAREKGCIGVAVSIHSNMSPKEQDALLQAFVDGKYMACVSDSKLKEGFDDPTLKTVFDYPRGSLVDKAQIIGRGARKWFNEAKNRFEGCTFIDTIVYVGSDDKELDKYYKETAIRNAVMAWSVLEGTAVFVPDEEFRYRSPGFGGGFGGVSAVQGLDVESYISLEDLQAIFAIKEKLEEGNLILFTNDMREELKSAFERTKISYPKLLDFIENPPQSLNVNKIKHWMRVDGVNYVDKDEWNVVLNTLSSLPTNDSVSLTKEHRAEIREIVSTIRGGSKSAVKFLKDAGLIHCKRIVTASISDTSGLSFSNKDWNDAMGILLSKAKIPLTSEMKSALKVKQEMSGLTFKALAKHINHDDITSSKIKAWCYEFNDTKNVERSVWEILNRSLDEIIAGRASVIKNGISKNPPCP